MLVTTGLSVHAAIDGYGSFLGSTTTAPSNITNLNQDTPYSIRWTAERFDSTYFTHSTTSFNQEITFVMGGKYNLSLSIPLDEVSGSNRRSVRAEVFLNGSPVDIARAESGYIRDTSNHLKSSLHLNILLSNISANDVLEVKVSKQTNQAGDVTTPGAQLFLRYVDNASKVISLKASQTTSGTNLNTTSQTDIAWDERPASSSAFTHSTASNSNELTFAEAGSYRVALNIPLQDPSACPGNNRTSVQARVKLNGTTVKSGIASQGYIRCSDDHKFSSIHWFGFLHNVTVGQKLTVSVVAGTTVTSATVLIPSAKRASLFLEKIEDTTKILSLFGNSLTSGNDWNPTSGGSIRWSGQTLKDASVYNHSTATNSHQITFNESGDYYIMYADSISTATARVSPSVQLRLNNSLPNGAECRSHYIRDTNSHTQSSCTLSFLLENVSAGDVLDISLAASAATGVANDLTDAEIHIFQIASQEPILDLNSIPNKAIHYDMSNPSNILDSSNRTANDTSFSGTVQKALDISGVEFPHDGEQTNASAQPTYDKVTKLLTFDGVNDYFDIANATDINTGVTSERTFAMVFRTGPDVTSRQLIYEEGGTARGINVYIQGGLLYLGFWNIPNDGDGGQAFVSTNTSIAASTNYYVTLVFDYSNYTGPSGPNGALRGTINGAPFSFSGSSTSRLYAHAGSIGLGAKNGDTCYHDGCFGGNGDYFGGDIFEFIMYNSAISPALEIEYYNYFAEKWPDPLPITGLNLTSQYTDDSSVSPQINWTASVSTDIDHYEIGIGTSPGATDSTAFQNVGNVTTATLSGLALSECINYYATIKAVDSEPKESTVVNSNFFKFDGTNPTPPGAIVLSGAASSSASRNFSWSASTDNCAFESYEVALGTTSGGSEVVSWLNVGAVLAYQFNGLALSSATDYFVSVRGVDSAGNISTVVSSSAWQIDSCVASDVISPTDPSGLNVSGLSGPVSSPNLTWAGSSDSCGLSHYELAIGTSAGASNVKSFTNVGQVLTHKFFSLSPALNTNTNYFFSLKAVDLAGNESAIVSSSSWQLPAPGNVSSGLVLWLDAEDTSTLFQTNDCVTTPVTSDGDGVGCWKDKSQSGFNATASAGTREPIYETNEFNGKAVIRFDGNNDALDFTNISTIRTVFVVNKSSGTTYQPLLGDATSNNWFTNDNSLLTSGASNFLTAGSWRVNKTDVPSPLTTTQNGQYSLYSVVSTGNVEADHISSDRKNNGRYFGGDYVELIIYNRALSTSEVTQVENYLYSKWFSAAPGPLSNLVLSSNFTSNQILTPSLSWDHSNAIDFSYYEIALGKTAGINDAAGFFNIGSTNSYQFSGTTLDECVDYFFSVRAVDTDGFKGELSSPSAFKYDGTAPSAPASLALSGSASASNSKSLSWAASTDNCDLGSYEVALGTTSGGSEVVSWTDVGLVNTHFFTGLSLLQATNYFLSVRSVDKAGNKSSSLSSTAWQIATCVPSDVTPPIAPSSLNLSGLPELRSSPTASWATGSDACAFSHHEIAIGSSSSTDDVVAWANIGSSTFYQFSSLASNLAYDTNYFINVRSVDQAGNFSTIASSSSWQLNGPGAVSASGLSMWIDVDKGETLFTDDACSSSASGNNTQVGCVKDLSGNDNNITTNLSSNKPIIRTNSFNGKNALYFDGATNEFLDFNSPITNIRTVFWVLKEDSSNPGDTAFLLGDPNGSTFDFHRGSTSGAIFSSTNSSALVRGGTLQINKVANNGTATNMPTSPAVLSLVTTGNVRAGSFSRDRLSCCGSRTFGGNLAELIIYNRALSPTEITNVENYLMTKWNLISTETEWTGAVSSDWFNSSNWSAGVPTSGLDCIIPDKINDPVISGTGAVCKSLKITTGNLEFQNATGAELSIFDDILNTSGTITVNDGLIILSDNGSNPVYQTIDVNGQTINLNFNKTAGSQAVVLSDATFNSLSIPTGSNFELEVIAGKTITAPNGLSINGGKLTIRQGATLAIGDGQTFLLNGGILKLAGVNDSLGASGQNLSLKAKLKSTGAGRWTFNSISGVIDFVGFIIESIDSNGLYVGGSTNLINFDGGQFTYLDKDYSSPVKALHLDTTATITESIAVNIGFNWGAPNTGYAGDPLPSDNYFTVYANNCGGGTLIFDQWFGDFWGAPTQFNTEDKIYDNEDGGNCNVTMDIAVSPVTITEFKATGYHESVLVEWVTGSELDHLGFNIYRSNDPQSGFVQINNELIRNYLTSGEFRGRYRFLDPGLTNNQIYYYMIEDVAINGDKELHGPVFALPNTLAGAAPAAGSSTNEPINDPGSLDLGSGISLLTQTNSSFRISINPSTISMTTSTWSNSYVDVSIPGYTKLSTQGAPELLSRRVLVPVNDAYTNVQGTIYSQTLSDISGTLGGKKVTPAPSFIPNGSGELIPQYSEDSNYYSSAVDFPGSYYTISSNTVEILGKHYVEIFVFPLQYEVANNDLERLDQLVLDIGLGAPAWDYTPPSDIYELSPSIAEGTIRLKYSTEGMYKVSYNDLLSLNMEGPLDGVDVDTIRGYYHGKEIPLEIVSGDNVFSSGDEIIFYGAYEKSIDDDEEEVVISSYDFNVEDGFSEDPLRILTLSPDINGFNQIEENHEKEIIIDDDNYAVFDVPVGFGIDHLFLKRIQTQGGSVPNSASRYSFTQNISDIDPYSSVVRVTISVSNRGVLSENPNHHLELKVNNVTFESKIFQTDVPVAIIYDVPISYFVSGNNTFTFSVLGDQVSVGDFDMLDIQSVNIQYDALNYRKAAQSIFSGGIAGNKFVSTGYTTSDISAYDISTNRNVFKVNDLFVDSFDGGSTYQVSLVNLFGTFGEGGKRRALVEDDQFLSVDEIILSKGVTNLIKNSENEFDHIIIAERHLIAAANRLAEYRTTNGLNSAAFSVDQVYGEFSHGRKSSLAINKFINFAKDNWSKAPRFVLIMGDASYDPKNNLGWSSDKMEPVLLYKGQQNDFASDLAHGLTDLGGDEESAIPSLSIGRLPTSNLYLIEKYIDKVIAYEEGSRAPSLKAKHGTFIIGEGDENEDFKAPVNSLAGTLIASNSDFQINLLDRGDMIDDEETRQAVSEAFDQGPLFMTYMGHGAEDLWGLGGFFDTDDADGLLNNELPIVMGLGCLNSYFYDADTSWYSLAERLVLNPDGGAIAFWGSTTLTSPQSQLKLATNAFNEFGQRSNTYQIDSRLGEVMLAAQSSMAKSGVERDMSMSWVLFGDPALKLPLDSFSEPAPAPAEAAPRPTADPPADKGGAFGCSLGAADGKTQNGPMDALEFILELLIYSFAYRFRKKIFLIRSRS
ncbi:MAG: hypothetical protein K9K67_11925 [Bacteriovoracaceae bacterium]|nr:hypothetical protein [Bacteriovoracaceae bacterium]